VVAVDVSVNVSVGVIVFLPIGFAVKGKIFL